MMRKLILTIGIGALVLLGGCSLRHFSTHVYYEDGYSECGHGGRHYDDHHWRHRNHGRYNVGYGRRRYCR